jgi:hypothetical protein
VKQEVRGVTAPADHLEASHVSESTTVTKLALVQALQESLARLSAQVCRLNVLAKEACSFQ